MATSSTQGSNLGDILVCVKCQDTYFDLVQLDCFHHCCNICLSGADTVICPDCNVSTSVPFEDEPLRRQMKEICDIISNKTCEMCKPKEVPSTHYCITCMMHLCKNDSQGHGERSDHRVIVYNDVFAEENLLLVLCKQDKNEHGAADKYRQKLRRKVSRLDETCVELEERIDILKEKQQVVDNHANSLKTELTHRAELVKRMVDQLLEERLGEVEQWATETSKEVGVALTQDKDHLKQVNSSKKYMNCFYKFASDADISKKQKLYCKKMDKIANKNRETNSYINPTGCDIKEFDIDAFSASFSDMFGRVEKLKTLQSCELETKWHSMGHCGVCFHGDDILTVGEKVPSGLVHVYGLDGSVKRKIECETVQIGSAWNVEVYKGEIYITDCQTEKKCVVILNKHCNVKKIIPLPDSERSRGNSCHALGLAIDKTNGKIFLSSCYTNIVYTCKRRDDMVSKFITEGLDGPNYLCATSDHGLLVSCERLSTVFKFNSMGIKLWKYGSEGTGYCQFGLTNGICVDQSGHIFVSDENNGRIHYITLEGKFVSYVEIGDPIDTPIALAMKNDRLIVAQLNGELKVIECIYT